jgi:hypothetical protein
LQVHLLGIAMLHRHSAPAPWHGRWVTAHHAQPSPAADDSVHCTACQIVQHSAVQPGGAAQILPSSASVPLIRRMIDNSYCSALLVTSHGRAPPLA